jgi:transposase
MSNRLEMSKVHSVLHLRRQGWSFVRIARELGIHRETASRYVREHGQQDVGLEGSKPTQLHSGSGDSKPTQVHSGSTEVGRSACEPFREAILAMLAQGLSAKRIHQDLTSEHGFGGSYHSVRRYVRRQEAAQPLPFRRIETKPGDEAQVDFGTGAPLVMPDGRRKRTHLFRIVLSYSRKAYSEVVLRQTTENFIRCLENAFWQFGGVPRTLVIDNLRAAVSKADWYEPEINRKVQSFCEHYGTVVLPTRPRMPRHKGKIEAGVKYTQNNALKGRTFTSLERQNDYLHHWETTVADTRIHGTTQRQVGKVFVEEERAALAPLPLERFPFFHEGQRKVNRDGHIEVDRSYYSTPPEYFGRSVWARWDSRLVRIFNQRHEEIAVHVKVDPGRFSTQAAHLAPEKISGIERGAEWLLRKASNLGEHADQWAQAVVRGRGIEGIRTVMGLLSLADKHTPQDIDQACQIAVSYGAFRLKNVRKLLSRQAPQQEQLEFTEDHPIIRPLDVYGELVRTALADAPRRERVLHTSSSS